MPRPIGTRTASSVQTHRDFGAFRAALCKTAERSREVSSSSGGSMPCQIQFMTSGTSVGKRSAALGADRADADGVFAVRTQATLDSTSATKYERCGVEQPADCRVKERVDREAGPERLQRKHIGPK